MAEKAMTQYLFQEIEMLLKIKPQGNRKKETMTIRLEIKEVKNKHKIE